MNTTEIGNLDISKDLNYDCFIVELLEVPLKIVYNRNIICKSLEGKIIWQVQDVFKEIPTKNSPFVNIEFYDHLKLTAYNFIGAQYYVDLKTGELELVYKKLY